MTKLLTAVVAAAGIGLGLNAAFANDPAASKSWSDFQSMVKRCNTLTGADRRDCMTNAREVYHASNFNCNTMSGADKTQCLKYGEEWKSAKAPGANEPAVTHDDNPTINSAPGDPTSSERNRDSTTQQEDATGNLPPKK